jgi:hypothetical protein
MSNNSNNSKLISEKNSECLTPQCEGAVEIAGVCRACYASHRRAVVRGETTWEAIEEAGLIRFQTKRLASAARKSAGLTSDDAPSESSK